jgi:hypothetical protein
MTGFLYGCIDCRSMTTKINYKFGIMVIIYHDSISSDDGHKDYSVEKDWEELKEMNRKEIELDEEDKEHIESGNYGELFQEGNVLSGKVKLKLRCPACFRSQYNLLEFLVGDGMENVDSIEASSEEIFFFVSEDWEVVSTNGKIIKTDKTTLIVWPHTEDIFEFSTRLLG